MRSTQKRRILATNVSYKDFTLQDVVDRFGLTLRERSLFSEVVDATPSEWLLETLREMAPLALTLGNEKARSELIITPILIEVRRAKKHRVGFFTGVEFNVDASLGLNGVCDWLLSRSPEQFLLRGPVIAVVEAKQENIRAGLGQCAAEMVAAWRYNERTKTPIDAVYGVVTTGDNWRFLMLSGATLHIDTEEYLLTQVPRVLGVFDAILREPASP